MNWNEERERLYREIGAIRIGWKCGAITLWSCTAPRPGPEWVPFYSWPVGPFC